PALVVIFIVSTMFLSLNLTAPLTDGMAVKQIYVAHKARTIAGPPFDLTRNTFDFLEPNGQRLALTQEIPPFTGFVPAAYLLFGDHEYLGRLLSIAATMLAILALFDWVRRDVDERLAVPAAAVFAFSPLLRVYGQAVQPDSCMLACMLLAGCTWSRFLERRTARWWFAALAAVTLGSMFKYYALMAVVPMAFQTLWAAGRSPRTWAKLAGLTAMAAAPVGVWMLGVFAATP